MQTLVLYIHLGFLVMAVVGMVMADASALAWLFGKKEIVHEHAFFYPHWLVTIGLTGLILTGSYLFWPQRNYLLGQSLFWLKMFFVVTLTVNSFFIDLLMHTASRQSFSSLGSRGQVPYLISGGISMLCWVGSALAAIVLFGWLF